MKQWWVEIGMGQDKNNLPWNFNLHHNTTFFFCGIGQIIEFLCLCVLIDQMDKISNRMPVTVCAKCFRGDILIEVVMGGGPGKRPLGRQPLSLTIVSTVLNTAEVLAANM